MVVVAVVAVVGCTVAVVHTGAVADVAVSLGMEDLTANSEQQQSEQLPRRPPPLLKHRQPHGLASLLRRIVPWPLPLEDAAATVVVDVAGVAVAGYRSFSIDS